MKQAAPETSTTAAYMEAPIQQVRSKPRCGFHPWQRLRDGKCPICARTA